MPPLGGWDVLDILLVSVLLYEALKLIRGTRAVQMAIGSVIILVLFSVSNLYPLQTVNWLIRFLAPYVVFALIVLFQEAQRRIPVQYARSQFRGGRLYRQQGQSHIPLRVNSAGMIRRALISVSDPTGLEELAVALHELGIEIIASSGTGARIEAAGFVVRSMSHAHAFHSPLWWLRCFSSTALMICLASSSLASVLQAMALRSISCVT